MKRAPCSNIRLIAQLWPATILLLLAEISAADKLQIVPELSSNVTHETNALVRNNDEVDGTSLRLTGAIDVRYTSKRNEAFLLPTISTIHYEQDDLEDLEGPEYRVRGGYAHSAERMEFGVNGRASHLNVVRSELEEPISDDPELPDDTSGGSTRFSDDQRTDWSLNPYLFYALTRRNSVGVQYEYQDVDYDSDGFETDRFDYDNSTLALAWRHTLTESTRLELEGAIGDYNSKEPETNSRNQSDTYSLLLGVRHTLSPVHAFSAKAGFTRTESSLRSTLLCPILDPDFGTVVCSEDESDDSFTGEMFWNSRWETTRVDMNLRRSVVPTSTGSQRIRLQGRVFVQHQFAPRLSGRMGAIAYSDDTVDEVGTDRDYVSVQIESEWRLARRWYVGGAYRYIWREREEGGLLGDTESANNNQFTISLIWRGLRRR